VTPGCSSRSAGCTATRTTAGVYGVRKVFAQLARKRDTSRLGAAGAVAVDGDRRRQLRLRAATCQCSWVAWFNQIRLLGAIGHVPPVESEAAYYGHNDPEQRSQPGQPACC